MKYGVNLMVWSTHSGPHLEPLFRRIKKWGFDGVEPFISPEEPTELPKVKALLDHIGLERTTCMVLPREAHLVSRDPGVRKRGVKHLETCAERTAELGASLMCGPLYAGLGVMTGRGRTEEEWEWGVEGLSEAARYANRLGVKLCLEPLNRFETYFLNTLGDAARLVKDIGAPNVGIHFDTFHANIEEQQPLAALRSVGKKLGHVHVSENNRGTPGTGHIDWRGVFSALKSAGYAGWVTIESFAEPDPALASAASIWRELAPSGDYLAREGLRFIKTLAGDLGIEKDRRASRTVPKTGKKGTISRTSRSSHSR